MTSDSLVLVTAGEILDVLFNQQVGLNTQTQVLHTVVHSRAVVHMCFCRK